MIIRDPAAILPLMGATGWGKGPREYLEMWGESFIDIFVLRLGGQDTAPSYPLTGCHTGRC